jgi:hypothetical protein
MGEEAGARTPGSTGFQPVGTFSPTHLLKQVRQVSRVPVKVPDRFEARGRAFKSD